MVFWVCARSISLLLLLWREFEKYVIEHDSKTIKYSAICYIAQGFVEVMIQFTFTFAKPAATKLTAPESPKLLFIGIFIQGSLPHFIKRLLPIVKYGLLIVSHGGECFLFSFLGGQKS